LVGLTLAGEQEASKAGKRIAELLDQDPNCKRIMLTVSPFERTLQTAHHMRSYFESKIVRTEIESRIREQEMGNIQSHEFQGYREEQKRVGRFWYRFPTGEAGSDVYDRVKSWWFESVLTVNSRVGFEPVDALVVVTHGLTQRFVLMQLFSWSPTTFHSVYNAENCDAYVLRKDLSLPGSSPYRLDVQSGDKPRSSIDVRVTFRNNKPEPSIYRLDDYISIPPPRTTRINLIKQRLAEQHSLVVENMEDIVLMPFIEGALVRGRTSSRSHGHLSGAAIKYYNKQTTPHPTY
jgi:broad specificity phosphatase PhoE